MGTDTSLNAQASDRHVEQSRALQEQIGAMQRLLECLEAEFQALQTRDADKLAAITDEKSACLVTAAALTKQLDLAGIAKDSSDSQVSSRREELDTLTKTCRDLNDANGALIRRQKMRIDSTLHILRGTEDQPGSYGPSGESTQASSSRTLLGLV